MPLPPDLIAELNKTVRGPLRTDRATRVLYSTDASIYQMEPLGVVIPRDQDDLQVVVELAAKYNVPVLPRGSGSSLAGQAIGEALILDCSRWLDAIISLNPEERRATVEPGVILASLNRAAARYGLQFGPDPASAERATMGGVIGNNATGAHSILYGMAADHLLEAEVVLSDGSLAAWGGSYGQQDGRMGDIHAAVQSIRETNLSAILQNYPKSWRNSAGYRLNYLIPWSPSRPPQWEKHIPEGSDRSYPPNHVPNINLAPLLAGSEGTLAVFRKVIVNLVPRPRHTILAVLAYDDIAAACDDVPRLLKRSPSAIELIPQSLVRLALSVPAYAAQASILDLNAEALLAVEFSGDETNGLKAAALALRPSLVAETREDQARVWNVRKVGLGLLASRSGDAKTVAFIEDCAIPVERLGEFVRGIERILNDYEVEAEFYAHASAGCLHIRPILDLKRQKRALRGIAEATLELTLSLGGSMSSEHGDGLARSEWLEKTYGAEVLAAFRALKQAADPHGILNPGKILDAPGMDSNLRFREGYTVSIWDSRLDFSREGGLAGAIEQCNGQGVCRKLDGTMCPSFQATREEMHSTRGRANLLRALISGRSAKGGGSGKLRAVSMEDTFTALDLCLACKGCKSECPSGVDMAKLKSAFLPEYYRTHLRPLRDYLFGYFHVVSACLSPLAGTANAIMQFSPTRRIISRLTGITEERPFPLYSKNAARSSAATSSSGGKKVLFLRDVFTHYIEPDVEQAALDLLAGAGFEVIILPVIGAGASLLSKGFIKSARTHAGKLVRSIEKMDPAGEAMIVGLEPPEIYTLKHDYSGLLPREVIERTGLERRVWYLDEFLVRVDEFDKLRIAILNKIAHLQEKPKLKVLPHCHQRAEAPAGDGRPAGTNATIHMLRSCGFEVEVIDSGCCGMAGTFGYEAEHYELSMLIGRQKLFPAIDEMRTAEQNAGLIATGSACRLQIEQGTTANSVHSCVYLARYL